MGCLCKNPSAFMVAPAYIPKKMVSIFWAVDFGMSWSAPPSSCAPERDSLVWDWPWEGWK